VNGIHEVGGSIPPGSTNILKNLAKEATRASHRLGSKLGSKLHFLSQEAHPNLLKRLLHGRNRLGLAA
jgi:hypothetical protein